MVRAFYRVFKELPYVRDGLIGLGVYGISEMGRARFDQFPELTETFISGEVQQLRRRSL